MSKFTFFVVLLVAAICVMLIGLINYENNQERLEYVTAQKAGIIEKSEMDDATLEHATEVEEASQSVADTVLEAATDEQKALVTEKGDTVTMDYVGISNGEEFEGGTAEDATLELGSESFIPGFELQLENHKVGDVVEVYLSFPDDYTPNPDLASQKALFVVTIKDITKA